jgi:hypothetical protein
MFDLGAYLDSKQIDIRLLEYPAGRRALTELDPLLFALLYLPHHVKQPDGSITLAEFHLAVVEQARQWVLADTVPRQHRDAYVAARNAGKSTWFHTILPTWAGAHRHRNFIAAFSDSATQAEMHLATFRKELDTNALLRQDFPDLCTPARKARGTTESDTQGLYIARSGFAFMARGMDSRTLGAKIGTQRPDLLILDDIEPPEETYSPAIKDKRLGSLIDSILPLNEFARVVLVGTVTMPDSIVHDLVRSETTPADAPPWIAEQNFRAHYFPALITDEETGEQRSIWPEKWPLPYLLSIQHTRDFKKNFQNDPMGRDGEYWRAEDFAYGTLPAMAGMLLSIDPAVTSKAKSDFTAAAVIGMQPAQYTVVAGRQIETEPKKCVVLYAQARRVQVGEPMRLWVLSILAAFPNIRGIVIEGNQGGDTWHRILHDMPVPVRVISNSAPKEVRAANLATRYQIKVVIHAEPLPQAEAQMVGFPKAPHDDLVDAIGNGVGVFLGEPKVSSAPPTAHQVSYV